MKLLELLQELEKNKTVVMAEPGDSSSVFTLDYHTLQAIESHLFECDEFKKVVRINYLNLPNYLVEKETGEPIGSNRDFIGGETDSQTVVDISVNSKTPVVFGKFVDLYQINIIKNFNTKAEITKPGVWIFPTEYDFDKSEAKNQIRVIWNQEQIEQALAYTNQKDSVKQRLVRMFETALNNMEPNLECEYSIMIRCSARSIVEGTNMRYDKVSGLLKTDN